MGFFILYNIIDKNLKSNNTPEIIDSRMGVVHLYIQEEENSEIKVTVITLLPSNN